MAASRAACIILAFIAAHSRMGDVLPSPSSPPPYGVHEERSVGCIAPARSVPWRWVRVRVRKVFVPNTFNVCVYDHPLVTLIRMGLGSQPFRLGMNE